MAWDEDPAFASPRIVDGPVATDETGLTAQVDLAGLPAGRRVHARATFVAPDGREGEPVPLVTRTAPAARSDATLLWSADTAGQGWGIDPDRGGMRAYGAMQRVGGDLFLHAGDRIYADGPILPEVKTADGSLWRNLQAPGIDRVAESLADYRERYAYPFLDPAVRAFAAAVPLCAIGDDHEVRNNWFPGQIIVDDDRYREKAVDVLAERGRRAMLDYTPLRDPAARYRAFPWGPDLEVFLLDGRSFRTPNDTNVGAGARFLGPEQLAWLISAMSRSKATWKIVLSDMPLSARIADVVPAGTPLTWDGWANGDAGPPKGRELEIATLLSGLKRAACRNVVFLTADVHYAAAHAYEPARAVFSDFDPFWEFVAGPLHASAFPPLPLDDTFGPRVVYQNLQPGQFMPGPPSAGGQSFGVVHLDAGTMALTVELRDGEGATLFATTLRPA